MLKMRIFKSKELAVLLLFLGIFAMFAVKTPQFATPYNLLNVARQYSELAVVAVGLTMVIIAGGIDISVGSVVGLSSIMVGVLAVNMHLNIWLACFLALLTGLACGMTNGFAITRLGIQPIVTTLAMMSTARGLAYVLSDARTISGLPMSFTGLDQVSMGAVPLAVVLALVIVVAGTVTLRQTAFGRSVYAVGANEEAARLSGTNTRQVKMLVYSLTGMLAGLSGIMMTTRVSCALPDAGLGFEFEAITAVVMGGSSLKGGEGNIVGTIIGVGIMGILRNGLNLIGVTDTWKVLFLGVMLIIAVLVDNLRTMVGSRHHI
ncbi:MAG: ABC transporter permease [Armatimonadetes bacterium]|nr:ABC transporter permease [Armatimonadota bacterium]